MTVYNRKRQNLAARLPPSVTRSGKQRNIENYRLRVTSKLAVALTCRQFYLEVTPIYYPKNTFFFPTRWSYDINLRLRNKPKYFAKAIGTENAKHITSISLDQWFHFPGPLNLKAFPNLGRLDLERMSYTINNALIVHVLLVYAMNRAGFRLTYGGKMLDCKDLALLESP